MVLNLLQYSNAKDPRYVSVVGRSILDKEKQFLKAFCEMCFTCGITISFNPIQSSNASVSIFVIDDGRTICVIDFEQKRKIGGMDDN